MTTHTTVASQLDQHDCLGHYEPPPLVRGGQGRDASDLVSDTFLYILFMLAGAGFVTLSIGPWWLACGVGVLIIVVSIVGSIAATPVD